MTEEPRFKHNCTNCRFLGQDGDFDLYFCRTDHRLILLARFSDRPPDYASMDEDALTILAKRIRGDNDDREFATTTRALINARLRTALFEAGLTSRGK